MYIYGITGDEGMVTGLNEETNQSLEPFGIIQLPWSASFLQLYYNIHFSCLQSEQVNKVRMEIDKIGDVLIVATCRSYIICHTVQLEIMSLPCWYHSPGLGT